MQLKATNCLYAETFMLAKNLWEMTTSAKTNSICSILRTVGKLLIIGLLCWVVFFPYTGRSIIVDIALCVPGGSPFIHTVYFVCEADTSCTAINALC